MADEAPRPSDALPPLVDTHCHLAWDSLKDEVDEVVRRARTAGVEQMVVVATDAATAEATRTLCEGREGLFPTTGIHPNDLPGDFGAEWAKIDAQARSGRFVAIGETGLDTYRDVDRTRSAADVLPRARPPRARTRPAA